MPTVSGSAGAATAAGIDYEFRVMADPGTQLKSFTVLDSSGMTIELEPPLEPCISDWYIGVARRVARNRFPLSVKVNDCSNNSFGPDEFPNFGVYPGYADGPDIPLPCSALECSDNRGCEHAQITAQNLRHELVLLCREVRHCRNEFKRYTIIAAGATAIYMGAFVLAGALSASGGWFGAIAATLLFIVAAVFFTIMIWATREAVKKQLQLIKAENRLHTKQNQFNTALNSVYELCCPGCIHMNTDMPCSEG